MGDHQRIIFSKRNVKNMNDPDMHGACDECLTGWHERCFKMDCPCDANDHKGVLV